MWRLATCRILVMSVLDHKSSSSSRGFAMISRRNALLPAIAGLVSLGGAYSAFAKKPSLVAKFDTDKDGTLDIKELQGRLSRKEFATADPDNDKTLTKDEYLAAIEKRFKAADPDNDGTVSAAEFRTASGQALARLLR